MTEEQSPWQYTENAIYSALHGYPLVKGAEQQKAFLTEELISGNTFFNNETLLREFKAYIAFHLTELKIIEQEKKDFGDSREEIIDVLIDCTKEVSELGRFLLDALWPAIGSERVSAKRRAVLIDCVKDAMKLVADMGEQKKTLQAEKEHLGIENNTIARIIADDTLEGLNKVNALKSALRDEQGMQAFEEFREHLKSQRLQIAQDLNQALNPAINNILFLTDDFEREAYAAARDFNKVARATGKILTTLASKGEALEAAYPQADDLTAAYVLLHEASAYVCNPDMVEELQKTSLELIVGLVQLQQSIKDNEKKIDKVNATAATAISAQPITKKSRPRPGA